VLLSIPQGLSGAAAVIFYAFLAGGALTIVEAAGAIGNTPGAVAGKPGHRPNLVLLLVSSLFLIGGASYAMCEEVLVLIPVLCALMRRLRLDNAIALGVSLGTTSVAAAFSPVITFHLVISQRMAELLLFSGFGFPLVMFVLAMGTWLGYLLWVAARCRTPRGLDGSEAEPAPVVAPAPVRPRDMGVLALVNAGMASLVFGAISREWGMLEFSAVFVGVGFAAGPAGGLGRHRTAQQYAEGFRRLAFAAVLIGFEGRSRSCSKTARFSGSHRRPAATRGSPASCAGP
jgi:uncharacterized ion transporter superfamily protein YfcC